MTKTASTVPSTNAGSGSLPLDDEGARNRLLRAAVDVFDRKGYAAASVREICERAGLTKPALYYHFGSKEGVLIAILEASAREFAAAVGRAVDRQGTAAERLAALCEEVYRLFVRHVPVARVAHAVYFGPREGAPPFDFGRFDSSLTVGIERILEDGLAAGEFRPAPVRDLSVAILGIIVACTAQDLHRPGAPIGPEGIRRVLHLVFEGVMTRPLPRAITPGEAVQRAAGAGAGERAWKP